MTPPSQLQVRIIYSASPADRHRVRKATSAPRSKLALLAVGTCVMNIIVGSGLCYAVWWPIKANVWTAAVIATPVGMTQDDMDALGSMFGIRPSKKKRISNPEPPPETTGPSITGKSAQATIWATAGGWISLMSLACVTLAASAGSIVGSGGNRWVKGAAAAFAVLSMMGLAGGVGYILWKYGMGFPSSSLRWGVAGLMGVAFLTAAWRAKSGRRWTRVASASILLATVGTAASIYLGHLCGVSPGALFPDDTLASLVSLTSISAPNTAIIALTAPLIALLSYATTLWITAKCL